ncbi:hypothetical protein [Flavobacterium sp. '19STA2R22 D10 B1']|uniref:hypothetical protein n=1 Tax=Flavobacterium aerium TaxID=3037261 RepID=UPI00278BE570|nr:hypothetical protein [Flavobacterium sp. '19STA2R22 D10 B1']
MSSTQPKDYNSNQEVDISAVFSKTKDGVNGVLRSFFHFLFFLRRNILILIGLFVVGAVIGFFLERGTQTYKNDVVVSPNFDSVDYLYNNINLIQSKINMGDTLFLKSIGISNPKTLKGIEIKPIIDVYKFILDDRENYDVLKLFSDEGSVSKTVKDEITSKNYKYHNIEIITSTTGSTKKNVEAILAYLNKNQYFTALKNIYLADIDEKLVANKKMIVQIDEILKSFTSRFTDEYRRQNDKLVYYNENAQLNDMIKTKIELYKDQSKLKEEKITFNEFVQKSSETLNVRKSKNIFLGLTFIVPVLFIFIFLGYNFFKRLKARLFINE